MDHLLRLISNMCSKPTCVAAMHATGIFKLVVETLMATKSLPDKSEAFTVPRVQSAVGMTIYTFRAVSLF